MELKELKKGEFFTLKQIEEPKATQVYIRGEYNRECKAYDCINFNDISKFRLLKGDRTIYTDFTF